MSFSIAKQYRLPTHDYSSDGYYFVTICTKNRENFFGEIKNGVMALNELGNLVAQCWQDIPNHFQGVRLDKWIIMPNHIHGIIRLRNHYGRTMINHGPTMTKPDQWIYREYGFGINRITKKYGIINNPMMTFNMTIGRIVRSFKGISTHSIRNNINNFFAWQPRFHDHVIRNENELNRIRRYIQNNPVKWEKDRNNQQDIWM